jgi:Cu(I)/Ag(I) efflux system protein CusF
MFTILARIFAVLALSASVASAAVHDLSAHHQTPAAGVYQSHGVVKKVAADALSIAHKPIPALNWPAMTMTFSLPAEGMPPHLKAGDTVDFTFSQQGEGYRLTSVTPTK